MEPKYQAIHPYQFQNLSKDKEFFTNYQSTQDHESESLTSRTISRHVLITQ